MKSNKEKSCTWGDITQADANKLKNNSAKLVLVILMDNMLNVIKECAFAEEKASNLLGELGRATLAVKENDPLCSKLVRLIWSAGFISVLLNIRQTYGNNCSEGQQKCSRDWHWVEAEKAETIQPEEENA